jgi:thiol-disulfide isomerase/thioredoxin
MNSTKSIVITVIILILASVAVFAWSNSSNKTQEENVMMKEGATGEVMMEEKGETMMQGRGSYEVYGAEKLALANEGKVILFFRASWCPSCKALDEDIRSNLDSIPEGVTILDVDYDKSAELKRKYAVTYQHTFVQVDASGNQIAKWAGSPTLAELVKNIK